MRAADDHGPLRTRRGLRDAVDEQQMISIHTVASPIDRAKVRAAAFMSPGRIAAFTFTQG